MTKCFKQFADDVMAGVGLIREGFAGGDDGVRHPIVCSHGHDVIDSKTKELMALAIGIAVHRDGCVAYHTMMSHHHGVAREEVAVTVALALYMGGGPSNARRGCPGVGVHRSGCQIS